MNKILTLTLLFLSVLGINTFKSQEKENSLLWKVEGNGIKPSYIFGTIHLIPEDDFVISENVKKYLSEADKLVLEMNMDDPSLNQKVMTLSMLPDGKTIQDYITPEQYSELENLLKENYQLPLESLKKFKPFLINSMLMVMMFKGENMKSYESDFMAIAKENDVKITGLETAEFQLSIFDKKPFEEQFVNMIEELQDQEASKQLYYDLVNDYKNQDIHSLKKAFEKSQSKSFDKEMMEELLDKRNVNWSQKLAEVCAEQKCFVAVGAGHLAGDKGLLNLLKEEGFTVTAVK